jgi:hypothetical protein
LDETDTTQERWSLSHTLDQLGVCFDDTHAIANAGLLLPATLASGWASSRPPMRRSTWASGPAPLIPAASRWPWCTRLPCRYFPDVSMQERMLSWGSSLTGDHTLAGSSYSSPGLA